MNDIVENKYNPITKNNLMKNRNQLYRINQFIKLVAATKKQNQKS